MDAHMITQENMIAYAAYLREQERAESTIRKYQHDLAALLDYLDGAPVTKAALIDWKHQLTATHAPASVNSMLTAVNSFLAFIGRRDLAVRLLKLQKPMFREEARTLNQEEYTRLVETARRQNNQRLSLVIQTICSTGIRVSELKFITVQAVTTGYAEVINKGKRRTILLPTRLRSLLSQYLKRQKKTTGPVFTTRTGRPLDRSNIWRDMKALCESAGVDADKVFPHNLRHLFARAYYALEKDLTRLADILGHSNVNTTRIYTAQPQTTHQRQLDRLGLILAT